MTAETPLTAEAIARQVREDIEEAERHLGHGLDIEGVENIVYENVRVALEDVAERVRGLPYEFSEGGYRAAALALLSTKEDGS